MDAEIQRMVNEMANSLCMIFMNSNDVNVINQQQHRRCDCILPIIRQLACSDKLGSTNDANIPFEIPQGALSSCIEQVTFPNFARSDEKMRIVSLSQMVDDRFTNSCGLFVFWSRLPLFEGLALVQLQPLRPVCLAGQCR